MTIYRPVLFWIFITILILVIIAFALAMQDTHSKTPEIKTVSILFPGVSLKNAVLANNNCINQDAIRVADLARAMYLGAYYCEGQDPDDLNEDGKPIWEDCDFIRDLSDRLEFMLH